MENATGLTSRQYSSFQFHVYWHLQNCAKQRLTPLVVASIFNITYKQCNRITRTTKVLRRQAVIYNFFTSLMQDVFIQ